MGVFTPTTRFRELRLRAGLLVAVAMLATACSSTGASPSATPTAAPPTTAPPTTAPTEAPTPVPYPAGELSIMAPAAPGGGWDSTARAIQQALRDAALVSTHVEVYNVEGAGGTIGLAQLIDQEKGKAESLMVMGLVMIGAIETNKSPVNLTQVTPLARLTAEYEAIAVKADSKYQTLAELVTDFKADPKSISWGGGSAGGTDHILVGLLAKAVGVAPGDVNYIAHSGGGEALDAILSGAVTAGVSGISEFVDQVAAGKMRYLAISGDARFKGVDAPTIKESGYDVVLANWRAIVAAPDITAEQRAGAVDLLTKMHASKPWMDTLEAKGWMDYFLAGDEFDAFLAEQQTTIKSVLKDIGLIQ